ncbi:MAG: hypothetical protein ACSHX8_12005 [Opitutaceae bacterium]
MEELREALMSKNIIVWIVLVIILVVALKLLKNAGKFFVVLLALIVVGFILNYFSPGILDPMIDFVRGGWLGEHRPDRPW